MGERIICKSGKNKGKVYSYCMSCMPYFNRKDFIKHKVERLKHKLDYMKKTNYKHEKTDAQRLIRNIKRKSRYHFQLDGMRCLLCGNCAEHRHHTTKPIEFDKFIFVCKKCHKNIHVNLKEVKQND